MKSTNLFSFFIFLMLLLITNISVSVNAESLSDNKVNIIDMDRGIIKSVEDRYLISGDTFFVYLNLDIYNINYSIGNQTILNKNGANSFLSLPMYDGATLIIKEYINNTFIEIFSGIILERNLKNLLEYGLGGIFTNTLIVAPFSFSFALLFCATKLRNQKKRVV